MPGAVRSSPLPSSPDLSPIPLWYRWGTHVIVALERPRPREARIDEARDDDDGAARGDVDGAVGPIGARDDDGDWDGAPPRDGPARGCRATTEAKIASSAIASTRRRRRARPPLARLTASDDGDDEPTSSASGTISALDALLGSADEPEPEPEPEPARGDDDETTTKGEGVSPDGAEAAGWPSLSLPDLPWGASSRGGEDDEERAIVRRAMENARAERSKSKSSSSNADANGSRVDYAVDEPYDPDFDPLGLGPRWGSVGRPTLVATLVAVEALLPRGRAGACRRVQRARSPENPVRRSGGVRQGPRRALRRTRRVADIVITAEVIQTTMAGVVAAVAANASPLPPG